MYLSFSYENDTIGPLPWESSEGLLGGSLEGSDGVRDVQAAPVVSKVQSPVGERSASFGSTVHSDTAAAAQSKEPALMLSKRAKVWS